MRNHPDDTPANEPIEALARELPTTSTVAAATAQPLPALAAPRRRDRHNTPPTAAPRVIRLRVREGAVIDFPAPAHPHAKRWAATLQPDPSAPDGWQRVLWWPSPWHTGYLPVALGLTAVIEFGADVPVRRLWRTTWAPVRWYGIVLEDNEHHLLAHGPYPASSDALAVAHDLRVALALQRADRSNGPRWMVSEP